VTTGQAAVVALARALPIAILTPALRGRAVLARAVLGGLLAAAVWPAVSRATGEFSVGAVVHELLVGLVLGLVAALPFVALRAAGALHDYARSDGEARAPLGEAYVLGGLAIFAALSGPQLVVRGLAASYAAFPVGGAMDGAASAQVVIELVAKLIASAVAIAAPALAAMLLVELVAGLVVRAQPAAEWVIGRAAVRTLVLVVLVAMSAQVIFTRAVGEVRDLPRALGESARSLGAAK
jgi:flagellar biosynthesis protein FliR